VSRNHVLAVLGVLLAVLVGTHPAVVLAAAAAAIALALGSLGFAITITVVETGRGPWCRA